jgi:hypothetical protein
MSQIFNQSRRPRANTLPLALAAIAAGCAGTMPLVPPLQAAEPTAGGGAPAPLRAVFDPPVELTDQDGKPIVTKLGAGHPVIHDWNGDGRMDLILGSKAGMFTMLGQALLIENVGTRSEPRFRWPGALPVQVGEEGKCFSVGCGCNTGGSYEIQPLDWNGDGYFDLLVNSRSRASLGAFLLLNNGKSRTEPRFERDRKLYSFAGHGHGSGGGDWNGDGIPDYCHHVNAGGWEVFLGSVGPGKTLRFALKPAIRSADYRMIGQQGVTEARAGGTPARTADGESQDVAAVVPPAGQRWFDNMVYAWNFSGEPQDLAKPKRLATFECERCRYPIEVDFATPVTELVASLDDANNTRSLINRYRIDHRAKTVECIETLAVCPANYARLSVGDLNQDGCMDVVYSGGVGGGQEPNTRIWVLYGKVKNVREMSAGAQSTSADGAAGTPRPTSDAAPQLPMPGANPSDGTAVTADVRQLFTAPVALTDTTGNPLLTRRSTGHPVICDWNGDGLNDLIIGSYSGMKTKDSEIIFLENKGTPAQPAFTWPPNQVMTHIAMPGATGPEPYRLSVNHPGTTTLELHPCDQNGDGVMDLVVNSGKHRGLDVFVLEGKGGGSGVPTFGPWARFQNITKGEPQCSGGGDWNGDGVPDYVHYVNTEGWQVHPGQATGKSRLPRFATNAALSSASYRLVGLDRWFDRTPYAWPFSGAQAKGAALPLASDCRDCGRSLAWSATAAVTEIVASMDVDSKPPKGTVSRSRIVYCRLDHTARTCTLLGSLAESDAAAVRLSIGDLNHDGLMDIVYTGGVSPSGDETHVHVIYGKAKPGP